MGLTVSAVLGCLRQRFGDTPSSRIVVVSAESGRVFAARGVSVDAAEQEVHLLVSDSPEGSSEGAAPMTVGSLLARLDELPAGSGGYSVVSGAWVELDEDYSARRDCHFAGIATSEDGSEVAFVESEGAS